MLYGIKALCKYDLTNNAKEYTAKCVTSLALNYPYLVPLLDEFVYRPCKTEKTKVEQYINLIYQKYYSKNYFEQLAYAFYYAVEYDVKIAPFDVNEIIAKNDCILSLCCLIYCRYWKLRKSIELLKKHAKKLRDVGELESQWPFVYECLSVGQLSGTWKELKKDKVSFLKEKYR